MKEKKILWLMIRQSKLESNQAEQLVYVSLKHKATFHSFIFNIQKQSGGERVHFKPQRTAD